MDADDDLEDQFFRLRDENYLLKKQANNANQSINLMTCRLNRLLEDKKRLLKRDKSRKEVNLEETVKDLELKIGLLTCENQRLKERELLLKTKLDSKNQNRFDSLYSHVRSRTDSGLGERTRNQSKPNPSNRLHRSLSTFSLNRVSFCDDQLKNSYSNQQKNFQTSASHGKPLKKNPETSPTEDDSSFHQRLKELQNEIVKLRYSVLTYLNGTDVKPVNQKQAGRTARKASESDLKNYNAHFNETSSESLEPSSGVRPDENRSIQVFHPSRDSSYSPPSKPGLSQSQDDISNYVSTISKQLSEAKETIKRLERQMLSEKSLELRVEEYKKKIDILNKENEVLQQSLAKCIGTCVSEIVRDSSDDDHSGSYRFAGESLRDRLRLLETEKQKLMSDLRSETVRNNLLESKYSNLKQSYDLLVNESEKLHSHGLKDSSVTSNSDLTPGGNNSSSKSDEILRKVIEERDSNLQNVNEIIDSVTNDFKLNS